MTESTLPTKKQRELLQFIDGFIKGNGYGPSYREIMRALGYKSVSTVAVHVDGLIARGWLIKRDNSARSLEVTSPSSSLKSTVDSASRDTVEQTIVKKIADLELGSDHDTLVETLRILGFDDTYQNHKS